MTAPQAVANPLATEIVKKLKRKKSTLAIAESITGGLLAGALTDVSGSSAVFLGGVVSYSEAAKKSLLHVPQRILTKHTAVSEEVALIMARSVRELFGAHYAISTTGVAGPGKAYGLRAGTAWLAIVTPHHEETVALALSGNRAEIRHATIESALAAFARILSS
ncbi:MAG: CinA family protein [Actinomycetes bacterium]